MPVSGSLLSRIESQQEHHIGQIHLAWPRIELATLISHDWSSISATQHLTFNFDHDLLLVTQRQDEPTWKPALTAFGLVLHGLG